MRSFDLPSGMDRRLVALGVGLLLALSGGVVWAGCGSSSAGSGEQGGFANVYLGEVEPGSWDLELAVRYQRSDEAWQTAPGLKVGNVTVRGVGLAQRPGDGEMLLGYTVEGTMKLHPSRGMSFERRPIEQLPGVADGPGIAHTGGDSWLVAYRLPNGRVVVRPFRSGEQAGLGPPLDLSGMERNSRSRNRPAIAYANGRLVVVWGRSADARAYRFLAADYDPATGSTRIVDQGEVPAPTREHAAFVAEPESSPALADDGAGTFYLGAIYRGVPGQPFNTIRLYSSEDGSSWRMFERPFPGGNSFHTGWTHIGLAARAADSDGVPMADLALAVISGGNPGITLEYSAADGFWRNTEDEAFGQSVTYYNDAIATTRLSAAPSE